MSAPWTVHIDESGAAVLRAHLFPGDSDEHGAVLCASLVSTERENRLLVRKIFLARDGVDYVHGQRGYKMLTAEFVRDCSDYCAKHGLAYLPVHNHGGIDRVAFSHPDRESHKRGYPSLVQFLNGIVCPLVFAQRAVAGTVWLPSGHQVNLDSLVVTGKRIQALRPEPTPVSAAAGTHHRQSLLLGEVGQAQLSRLKVGVIGAGGVGSLIVQFLGRLGVGHLIVVDPDLISESNFSRIPETLQSDYRSFWGPKRKVDLAKRMYMRANPKGRFDAIFADFRVEEVATRFVDCDFLFLAADPMSVRLLFNQVVNQYLIPGAAIGSKVVVDERTGHVKSAFSIVRSVRPGRGCLFCNGYISRERLGAEAAGEHKARPYIDDPNVAVPSVITLNAVGAGLGSNAFLFGVTDLGMAEEYDYLEVDALTGKITSYVARQPHSCGECSPDGRLAAGSSVPLTSVTSKRRG